MYAPVTVRRYINSAVLFYLTLYWLINRKEVLQMMNLKGIIGFTTVVVVYANMVIYWAWFMK